MDEQKKISSEECLRDATRSKLSCKMSKILQELHQDQDDPLLLSLASFEELTDDETQDFPNHSVSSFSSLSSSSSSSLVSHEVSRDLFSSPLTVHYVSDEDIPDTALVRSSTTSLSTSFPDSEPTASGSFWNVLSNEAENVEADATEPRTSSSSADSSRSSRGVDEQDYDADADLSDLSDCDRCPRRKRIKLS